jgi:hypothetical protein
MFTYHPPKFNYLKTTLFAFSFTLLTACTTPQLPLDPVTKHYQANDDIPRHQITADKPANLTLHNTLVVRLSGFEFEKSYVMQAIKNQHLFQKVETPETLPLSEKIRNDEFLNQLASTNLGLKKLSKKYGNFLVLDIHQAPQTVSEDIYFKLYDPVDEEVYLAGHYNASGFPSQKPWSPLLNLLADWANKSKNH